MNDMSALLKKAMAEVAEQNAAGLRLGNKRYTTVAVRVECFRRVFGLAGRIRTEMLHADAETVVMQAHIEFLQDGQWHEYANGYAEERRNSSQVNRTSAVENCESSAVGRALANLGLHGGEYASANEVENAIHQQTAAPAPEERISAKQLQQLRELADSVGADIGKMLSFFHVETFEALPAKDFNRAMQILEKKRKGGKA